MAGYDVTRAALLLILASLLIAGVVGAGAGTGGSELDDAVIAFDRYACPSGWIEYGGPTRRVRPSRRADHKAPEQDEARRGAEPKANGNGVARGLAGPQRARFGLVYCRKL